MGKVIFILIGLFFAIQIFKKSGPQKLVWFFAGILFFPPAVVITDTPQMTFPRFITYILLLSLLINHKREFRYNLKRFPLKRALYLIFVCLLAIGLFDGRVELYLKIYRPLNYFVENFLPLLLTFCCIKSVKDYMYVVKHLVIFMLVFGLYGLSNYITRSNEYYSIIADIYGGRNFSNDNMAAGLDRFRIASFAWHAIYYGFLLATVMLQAIFAFSTFKLPQKSKNIFTVGLALMAINLLLVNSRTPLYILAVGMFIFSVFATSIKQKMKIALLCIGGAVIAISYIPSVSKLVDASLNTFSSSGSDIEGSSIEMREVQLGASVIIFAQNPVFGNGFSYITEGLGYSSDAKKRKTGSDLMGFESYVYKLLIEQGIVGIVGNILFFIALYVFFIKTYRKVSAVGKKICVLSLAMITSFILFIVGTGDLGTFLFFMAVLGMNMKAMLLSEKQPLLRKLQAKREAVL